MLMLACLFSFLSLFWFGEGGQYYTSLIRAGEVFSLFYFGKSMCKIRMNCSLNIWKLPVKLSNYLDFVYPLLEDSKILTQFLYWLRGPLMPFSLLESVLNSFYFSSYSFLLFFSNICNRDACNISLLSVVCHCFCFYS